MGSKSRVAREIVGILPKAETLVDLFAGGCAITHAAIKLNKWNNVIANDIDWMPLDLFKRALRGEFKNEKRFKTREEFMTQKTKDPFIRYIWSFGNKGDSYLYSKEIEMFKKALFMYSVQGDFSLLKALGYDEKSFLWNKKNNPQAIWKHYKNRFGIAKDYEAKAFVSNDCCNRMVRLNAIGGKMPQFSNKSYEEVKIPENSVVYCDIPYQGTAEYRIKGFDYTKFFDWCSRQDEPLFISSYDMPENFKCVWGKKVDALLKKGNGGSVVEKLFVPIHQYERSRRLINEQTSLF